MFVSEYCSNCDKRTMRDTSPCPHCTPVLKNDEALDLISQIAYDISVNALVAASTHLRELKRLLS